MDKSSLERPDSCFGFSSVALDSSLDLPKSLSFYFQNRSFLLLGDSECKFKNLYYMRQSKHTCSNNI